MTGEITLRGLVLPIGGLKEKTLAAKRAGIKQVIVPKRNEKDMPDIPQEVRNTLKFHFVDNIDQVLKAALGTAPRPIPEKPVEPRETTPPRQTTRRNHRPRAGWDKRQRKRLQLLERGNRVDRSGGTGKKYDIIKGPCPLPAKFFKAS